MGIELIHRKIHVILPAEYAKIMSSSLHCREGQYFTQQEAHSFPHSTRNDSSPAAACINRRSLPHFLLGGESNEASYKPCRSGVVRLFVHDRPLIGSKTKAGAPKPRILCKILFETVRKHPSHCTREVHVDNPYHEYFSHPANNKKRNTTEPRRCVSSLV